MVDQAEIHRKATSDLIKERRSAVRQLRSNFAQLPNKEDAWDDLIRLTFDDDRMVQLRAVHAWGIVFPHLSNKERAWGYLSQLTWNEAGYVRRSAAYAICAAFPHIPDKKQALKCLNQLTRDGDGYVRWGVADAMGSAFPHIPDKEQVLGDLRRLTRDGDCVVRMSANHSLGKVSIFKVTKTNSEENFRKEFEKSLEFFEKSLDEPFFFNPSRIYLPFYKSFYTIAFKQKRSKYETYKYLNDAKIALIALKESNRKQGILEAVKNLENILAELSKVHEMGFDGIKSAPNTFDTYVRYCNRITELIDGMEDNAPLEAKQTMESLPLITRNIKELLEEVRKKSENVCKNTSISESELGCRIKKHAATALARDDLEIADIEINCILKDLERWSHSIISNKKIGVQEIILRADNLDTKSKLLTVCNLLDTVPTFTENTVPDPYGLEAEIRDIFKSVYQKKERTEGVGN